MRDKILDLLNFMRNNAIEKKEILRRLSNPSFTMAELDDELKRMSEDKLIYCTNSRLGTYTLNPFKEGVFKALRNGKNIVVFDDKEVLIDEKKTYGARDGDKVLVRINDFNTYTGTIKEIIERHGIVAEVKTINKESYAIVGQDRYKIDLPTHVVDGMLIGILIDKEKSGKYYRAKLDRILGHKNAPRLAERIILYEHDFPDEFSEAAIKELDAISNEVTEADIIGRTDLRNEEIFTIDGDDTKDIDDAISLKILDNGNYQLNVHIADVAHYVKEGSIIDKEASERGTSVYMPGVVNPMYPYFLSNGICSLNPLVDRLALTCSMEINNKGEIINYHIFKSVIHSKIQMTYSNVNKILEENIIPKGYEVYVETLKKMEELSKLLKKYKNSKGMLDFGTTEIKINTDADGKVLSIDKRIQRTAESLIEYFMIAMNESVATFIYNMGVHSLYRIHDLPNEEKLVSTINIIKSYGENINPKINYHDPRMINKVLDSLKNSDKFDIYSMLLLRSMAKASYKTYNLGHYGLGVQVNIGDAYTHSTSPIRRYPDTTIHRILHNILDGNLDKVNNNHFLEKLNQIAFHSSERELSADACERDANKLKMAEYLEDYIGKIFDAIIIGFTYHGMFVRLDNLIEGRVGFETMDDYFNYYDHNETIVGEHSSKTYRLGDKVKVVLIKASKENKEIDFELVRRKSYGNRK